MCCKTSDAFSSRFHKSWKFNIYLRDFFHGSLANKFLSTLWYWNKVWESLSWKKRVARSVVPNQIFWDVPWPCRNAANEKKQCICFCGWINFAICYCCHKKQYTRVSQTPWQPILLKVALKRKQTFSNLSYGTPVLGTVMSNYVLQWQKPRKSMSEEVYHFNKRGLPTTDQKLCP